MMIKTNPIEPAVLNDRVVGAAAVRVFIAIDIRIDIGELGAWHGPIEAVNPALNRDDPSCAVHEGHGTLRV